MSPLRSSAGPATCRMPTPSSLRTICASDVLPSPGGPASSTWSSASPRAFAASSAICSCSLTRSWPTKSSSDARPQRPLELLLARRRAPARGTASCGLPAARARTCSSTAARGRPPRAHARRRSASSRARRARRARSGRRRRAPSRRRARASPSAPARPAAPSCRPMPGIAWNRFTSSRAIALAQLGRRRAGDDRERDLRADAGDAEQQLEQLALVGGREAVELQRVLTDDACGSRSSPRRSPRRCTVGVALTR